MITISGVKKVYQSVEALKDINLDIHKGEIFGVIGYSGAGKSTLVRLINLLEQPTEGSISVDDKEMTTLSKRELMDARKEIGMIFQHFNLLWSRTVKDNIAFPLEISGVPKRERDKRTEELIHLVGLQGKEQAYPAQLSGGQKQRVGIARALANKPKVLLCDEATSALDPKTTDSILDLLVDINQKLDLTIVLITHEMHVIKKICHRVAVLDEGEVAESGPVLDVFKHPQQSITKDFVKQITEHVDTEQTTESVQKSYPNGTVVRFTFTDDTADQPLIYELIRYRQIEINILEGNISQTQAGSYGSLTVLINGSNEGVEDALEFAKNMGVEAEVIRYAENPVS